MGNDLQKGTVYAEGGVGGAGTVNASNLNAHVDEARIKATFISGKTLKDPASLGDSIVVENAGVLYRQTHQQIVDLINTTIQTLLPIGAIIDFAGTSAPTGWLFCAGQAVLRDTYDDLFAVIGITYGAGDSVTTFNLPDLRGRTAAGKDDMGGTAAGRLQTAWGVNGAALGAGGGAQSHTLTIAQMPSHQHKALGSNPPALYNLGGLNLTSGGALGFPTGNDYVVANEGGSTGHPIVQPTLVLNKIIRAQS